MTQTDLLKDKVVLVTGGSSGIRQAAAHAFAEAGAKVVLAARGAERGEAVVVWLCSRRLPTSPVTRWLWTAE